MNISFMRMQQTSFTRELQIQAHSCQLFSLTILLWLTCLDVCSSILSTSFACFLNPASLPSQFLRFPLTVIFANVCLTTLSVVVPSGCLRTVFFYVSKMFCPEDRSFVSVKVPSPNSFFGDAVLCELNKLNSLSNQVK